MTDKTIEYVFDTLQNNESYGISSTLTNYAFITDMNNGNYSQGLITFSNTNLQGAQAGSMFDLSEAIYHIPITYTLTINNGAFGTVSNGTGSTYASNKWAVTKKGNHHFFHNIWGKLGGVDIYKNATGYNNFYINEVKKRKSLMDTISDDVDGFYLDSTQSFNYNNTVGEYNNESYISSSINNGNAAAYLQVQPNTAIWKRNNQFIDISLPLYTSLTNPANYATNWQPYFTNGQNQLQWNDVLCGKLSDISDVFGKCPPLMHLNGFELKLQMNAGQAVSYTVNYAAANNPALNAPVATATTNLMGYNFPIASFTSNVGSGQTCPLLISSARTDGLSGLAFNQINAATVSVTLTINIGWGAANSAPCRLLVPWHKLNVSELERIEKNPVFSFYANHFELDFNLLGFAGGSVVQRTLASQYRRLRKMFIIPYLSNNNTATGGPGGKMIYPFQSLISSAPNTCSICKLKNFNIQVGGVSLFQQEQLYSPAMFYDENYQLLNSMDFSSDNAKNNPLKSGRIKKSEFIHGAYNVYCIDLQHALTDEDDGRLKQVYCQWIIDAPTGILYDFMIIFECSNLYQVDAKNGILVSPDFQ